MEDAYQESKLCNSQIQRETNTRIYDRNIPSQMLQPYLDVRPVLTKYSYFPIVDPRKPINVPMEQMPTYNVHKTFNPGNTTSPWSGRTMTTWRWPLTVWERLRAALSWWKGAAFWPNFPCPWPD